MKRRVLLRLAVGYAIVIAIFISARPALAIGCGPYVKSGICSPQFYKNQQLGIRSGVPFVWLRSAPSSAASAIGTVNWSSQLVFIVSGWPESWDGDQSWWLVTVLANPQLSGWVEQASLARLEVTAPRRSSYSAHIRTHLPFAWIRATPSTNGAILGALTAKDTLTVRNDNPTKPITWDGRQLWQYVESSIGNGWVEWSVIEPIL